MTNKEWYKLCKETFKIEDEVILLESKDDLIKAHEILSPIGIIVFSTEEKKEEWTNHEDRTYHGFLVKEDSGWRIQSHYLGFGTPVSKLEEVVQKYRNEGGLTFSNWAEKKKVEDNSMKMYYFNPNSYGEEYFVMAENKNKALEYLLNFLSTSEEEYNRDQVSIWENVNVEEPDTFPTGYTLDEHLKGQVVRTELC